MGNVESLLEERPFKPNNDRVRLYRLCNVCKTVISSSPLLRGDKQREDFLSGSAFSNLLPTLDTDSLMPFDPEFSAEFGQGDRDGPFYLEGEYPHCISAAALEASAGSGCHLCSLLWLSISTEPSHRIGLYIHRDFKIFKAETNRNARTQLHFEAAGPPDPPLVVRIGHRRSSHSTECGVIALYAGRVRNSPIPKLRSVLKVLKSANMYEVLHGRLNEPNFIRDSISTTSDAVFGMIENWLKDCMANHEECNRRASSGVAIKPGRLIDVGPPDGSTNPRLHICDSLDQELSYVALSHCWGGTSPLMLTSTSHSTLLAGLPLSSFPATFRDAIQITRRLRQRYLWIDSLCIFQDSVDDWNAESARMGAIYQNCTFSIAALSGRNSHHGCFATRNPLSYRPLPLPCKPDYYFIQTLMPYPWTEDSFTRAPLLRRGWVLQERCLAPRTLYFGDHGVYWECRQARMDENHRTGKGRKVFERESGDLEAKMTLANVKLETSDSSSGAEAYGEAEHWFLESWYRLIEHYATCKFTFGRDKLVAIAGVVDDVQRRTGLSSFAGLWREHLLRELLWSVNVEEPCSRPAEYRAPTFSWASLDGFIVPIHEASSFHGTESGTGKAHPEEKMLATILEAEVKVANDGHTSGAVTDGHIVIEGPVKRGTVHNSQTSSGLDAIWTHPEQVLEQREETYRARKFCKVPNRWLRLDTKEMDNCTSLDIVLVMVASWSGALTGAWAGDGYNSHLHVAGIVLQSNGEKPNTYRRIGMFEDCFDESSTSWWKDWGREVVDIV